MKERIVAVCGRKNAGKTTLVEKLVVQLTKLGLRVAVIKHDGHDFTCDIPGTDSDRFLKAGAYGTAVYSARRMFVHRVGTGETAPALFARFPEADLILLEGEKGSTWPKIEVVREAVGRKTMSNPEGRFLIVTDLPGSCFAEPTAGLDDVEEVVRAILQVTGCENPQEKAGHRMGTEFTHFDEKGNAWMVDVGGKDDTRRAAVARGIIRMSDQCFAKVTAGTMAKGDVLGVARIAGIMGAKQTAALIPLCHILLLTRVSVDFSLFPERCEIEARCQVETTGKTGVEMEALTGVNIALLTIYDMCKAVDKGMEITDICLLHKSGGKSGTFDRVWKEG